jgi:hypothetical protein
MVTSLEDNGDTLLTGSMVDQAALHGLLRKARDLGMPLLSILHVEPEQGNAPSAKPHQVFRVTQRSGQNHA